MWPITISGIQQQYLQLEHNNDKTNNNNNKINSFRSLRLTFIDQNYNNNINNDINKNTYNKGTSI